MCWAALMSYDNCTIPCFPLSSPPLSSPLPPSLTQIDLTNGHMHWPMIERFYLGQNKLSELPREIGDLRTLTCIDISQNPKIPKLPNELGRLEHLYMVCVGG